MNNGEQLGQGDEQSQRQHWTPPEADAPTVSMASTDSAADTVPAASGVLEATTVAVMPAVSAAQVASTEPLSSAAPNTALDLPTQPLSRQDTANLSTVSLAAPAPGELLRFGPGVPIPTQTIDLGRAAAVWRGESRPGDGHGEGDGGAEAEDARRRRRRRLIGWLLPLLVLVAVLAILLWQRSGPSLTVAGAAVQTASPNLDCDGTATVAATMHTNGVNGTITYRWRRSDGTVSDTLRQHAAKGSSDVHVVLLWSFHGQGTMKASATLEVLSPSQLSASASFTYTCR